MTNTYLAYSDCQQLFSIRLSTKIANIIHNNDLTVGFPHRLENFENGRAFSSQGKVRKFEHTGKVKGFYTKYWTSQENLDNVLLNMLEESGNFTQNTGKDREFRHFEFNLIFL